MFFSRSEMALLFPQNSSPNEAYTVTFGDRAENETGMQIIGTLAANGMSVAHMRNCQAQFTDDGTPCKIIDLRQLLRDSGESVPEAAVLVVRGGVNALLKDPEAETKMLKELQSMPKDKQTLSYGRVVNKHARHNNTMGDFTQAPDIPNGKGTVVDFKDFPVTDKLRHILTRLTGAPTLLTGELNHYFNADKCGIGFHGDAERKLVVGVRFGSGAAGMPLKYQWYKNGDPIGYEGRIELFPGDVYFMSEKAVGFDFKRTSILTLRHAAGKETCTYSRVKRKAGYRSTCVMRL
jgi:hypothetical protein